MTINLMKLRQALQRAKLVSPVVAKLLGGTMTRADLPELARVLEQEGAGRIAGLVRDLERGTPSETVLRKIMEDPELRPLIVSLFESLGTTDLKRALVLLRMALTLV